MTSPEYPCGILHTLTFPFRLIWDETNTVIHQILYKAQKEEELDRTFHRNPVIAANHDTGSTNARDTTADDYLSSPATMLSEMQQEIKEQKRDLRKASSLRNVLRKVLLMNRIVRHSTRPIEVPGGEESSSQSKNQSTHSSIWPVVTDTTNEEKSMLFTEMFLDSHHGTVTTSWLTNACSFLWSCLPTTILYRFYTRVTNYLSQMYTALCELFPFQRAPIAALKQLMKEELDHGLRGQQLKYAVALQCSKTVYHAYEEREKRLRHKMRFSRS